ncbi:helix-turn-helix domain-containing protein [Streptomyces jumonjinensis]|uniref:Helix-turn-helix transcriptional regulator n=1 Tax=Streptomyces jumonjinensis TaxID=1945 RepID=A0A646KS15_STRJU|nr:helix-turn-helix transcriptional regulator [Streptomyces jumonjinensis]MQT04827.1 helix-turn-helix transcriptional regulator [Streptomyces jumonjinensis]
MTTNDWAPAFTARVASQMRRARKAASLTVADASAACTDLGLPVPKTTITNLELGRRTSVDLGEFLVLAKVYGVPPVTLMFPLDAEGMVEVLPGQEVPTWDGLAWFTGETRLDQPAPEGSSREVLDLFRAHSDAVATALTSARMAKERRRKAALATDAGRRDVLLETVASYEELAREDRRELHAFRERMRERDLVPPGLPPEVAVIDKSSGEGRV